MIARYPRHGRRNGGVLTRSQFARTNASFLINDPATNPADSPPIWWLGVDGGGGATPIGPNGPWSSGWGWTSGGTGMWAGESADQAGPSVITRATALITGPLSAAPYTVLDTTVLGRQLPTPRWLSDPMQLRPDLRIGDGPYPKVNRLARSVFWADWFRSAIWWGEGPMIYAEDAAGQPVAGTLRLLNPLLLSTDRDQTGALIWAVGADDPDLETAYFDRDGYLELGGGIRYRICVLRNPHSSVDADGRSTGVFGLNPGTFRLGGQIETYASGTFRSGVPAGYLKVNTPDAKQDKIDQLKANWLAAHGGDRRSIAVLNASTEFVPLNLSPVDAALVDMSRLSIAQIAYAFGLDPGTLGVSMGGSMTYNNVRDIWVNHRDFGLAPWIAAGQDTLSALTPAGQEVLIDLDGFANPTRAERYNALKVAIEAGILTIDEARQLEGLPPLEEPDAQPAQLQIVGPVTGPPNQPAIEAGGPA